MDLALPTNGAMRTGPFGSDLLHSEFVGDGVRVLGIDNAVENRFRWNGRRYITQQKYQKLKRYRVYPGDVLITIMGTTGRSAVVPDDIGVAINTKHLVAITLERTRCLPEYLSFSVHSDPYVLQQITDQNRGAIMAGLNLSIIKNVRIRVPPTKDQDRFVSRLRQIARIRESCGSEASRIEDLTRSLAERAFRGELST